MRFATKVDRWLAWLLILAAIVTCLIIPGIRLFAPGAATPLWLAFLPLLIWLAALTCALPQYYEVQENGLFVRQGWRKRLIPYASLLGFQPLSDSRSAPVFSTDRLLVETREGNLLIAVAEQERFLAEVSKRCPQLEQTGFGLKVRFASGN
jgi:hypothetical protein